MKYRHVIVALAVSAAATLERYLLLGANTPWKRVRLTLGLGTSETNRAIKSNGSNITEETSLTSLPFGNHRALLDRQEHGDRHGAIARRAAHEIDRLDPLHRIEFDHILFGVHDHIDATDTISHLHEKLQHGPQ